MNNEEIDIGQKLREVRLVLNLTQKKVAEAIGLKQVYVSRLENGRELSRNVFIKFIKFYSKYVFIDFLFDDDFDVVEDVATSKMLFKNKNENKILSQKIKLIVEDIQEKININKIKNMDNIESLDAISKQIELLLNNIK